MHKLSVVSAVGMRTRRGGGAFGFALCGVLLFVCVRESAVCYVPAEMVATDVTAITIVVNFYPPHTGFGGSTLNGRTAAV